MTDEPLLAGVTEVDDTHILQLRTGIDLVRAAADLGAYTWQRGTLLNTEIAANDVIELRAALDAALSDEGATSGGYTDTIASTVTLVKAVHLMELRERIGRVKQDYALTLSDRKLNQEGGTPLTITSTIPSGTVSETIRIKNVGGAVVRTMVFSGRTAGTYNDTWNGTTDAGATLPAGAYFISATFNDGTLTTTIDDSNIMRGAGNLVVYPDCSPLSSNETPVPCGSVATAWKWDAYANGGLKISFSLTDAYVVDILQGYSTELSGVCGDCIATNRWLGPGSHSVEWRGVLDSGAYSPQYTNMTVKRGEDKFPVNAVVLYGQPVPLKLSNLTVTPPVFSPTHGRVQFAFDMTTFGNASAPVVARILRQAGGLGPDDPVGALSTLTTIDLGTRAPGRITFEWDGTSGSYRVAPGLYAIVINAQDSTNTTITLAGKFTIVY